MRDRIREVEEAMALTSRSEEIRDDPGKRSWWYSMKCIPKKKRAGYVYFVEAVGTDSIKIGFSVHPPEQERLVALRGANPVELRLLGWIPGTMKTENSIHKKFADARIRGEWFRATEEVRGMVERCIQSPPPKFETLLELTDPATSSIAEPTIQDQLRVALAEGRHDPDLLARAAELIDDMIDVVRELDRREAKYLEEETRNPRRKIRSDERRSTILERLKEQTDENGSHPYS